MIGEFEYLILTAAAGLGDKAYGAAIRAEIEAATGQKCSIGALYTTIDRLEAKGLLHSWMGEATAQRGGRSKRMVRVTGEGVEAAKGFYEAVARISRGAAWVANRDRESSARLA
jgi:PadR family transcriptional regulator, regulatory protein PadR